VPDHGTRYGRPTAMATGDVPRFWAEISGDYERREFVEQPDQDGMGIGALTWPGPAAAGVPLH
jgi:hypothetical protein